MSLLELNDFDFWVDGGIADDIYKFSPVFVFLIGWAYDEGLLNEEFVRRKSISRNFEMLLSKEISFRIFVDEVLEKKLESSMFVKSVREFVSDYIEYDGYSFDMSDFFQLSVWDFPQDLVHSKEIYTIINQSKQNYERIKTTHPDLVIFESDFIPD